MICSSPYPMMLMFSFEGKYQLWTAHQRLILPTIAKPNLKRLSASNGRTQTVIYGAGLISVISVIPIFLICIRTLLMRFLYSMLKSLPVRKYVARKLVNCYAEKAEIDKQIATLCAELKNATEFNRKMEIDMKIKKLEKQKL